uniref:Ig-like domain-containing protein n=1 Tax=Cricetulus griseus TaxID=10029 RepID=A0A8C2LNQ4_CRIGR
ICTECELGSKGCEPGREHHTKEITTSNCGCPSTCAQITIESVPSSIVEGESVLLVVYNLPENLRAFFWYKGGIVSKNIEVAWHQIARNTTGFGPAYSGREIVYSNGSLLLQNVTWKDTGFYTLRTLSRDLETELVRVQLQLDTSHCGHHPSTQPTVESVPPSVAEGGNALLVVHNLPKDIRAISWYKGAVAFKNQEVARRKIAAKSSVLGPAHSGRETMYSNGSLLLQNVTRNDAGFYTLRTVTTDLKVGLVHVKLLVDTCRLPPPNGQLSIELMPTNVAEGKNALLLAHNMPENLVAFHWYLEVAILNSRLIAQKDTIDNKIWIAASYSGRVTVYHNGSLLFHNATKDDTGFYSLVTISTRTQLQVTMEKPVTQPFIQVTSTTVTAQSSVVFTCLSGDTGVSICWIFNNRNLQLTERMTLSPTKCQLSIDPVRREDAGDYQCEVFNPVSSRISLPVSLAVTNE